MFTQSLEVNITLNIENQEFKIPAGNIKQFAVNLTTYGFSGEFSFWISSETKKDDLLDLFLKNGLIKIDLSLSSHYIPSEKPPPPMILNGIANSKEILQEMVIDDVKKRPVLWRYYHISFADPAKALWSQHFPTELYTEKTLKDVIDAQKNEDLTISYDWDVLDTQHPQITLGLGSEDGTGASFYDFIMWYVDNNNGIISYDHSKNTYKISNKKDDSAEPSYFYFEDVENIKINIPEPRRYTPTVLNGYSEEPQQKPLSNENSVNGIKNDILICSQLSSDVSDVVKAVEAKAIVRQHELDVTFCNYPRSPIAVNGIIKFDDKGWSDQITPKKNSYRIRNIDITAVAEYQESSQNQDLNYNGYDIDMRIICEQQKEEHVCIPKYKTPIYPVYIEGKIFSETGEDDDETYQIYQDKDSSVDQYKVMIPLWDKQKVVASFNPNLIPGHFYFPAYKGARVLVSLDLLSARIKRFLDWRPGARLPQESQGNQILFGQNDKSNTSLNHIYDNKKPVLNIKRTSDKDTEAIQFAEGTLILETKEEE